MKRLLFIVTMLAACININAETQCDVILTTKNFQIPCTIIKIGEMEVQVEHIFHNSIKNVHLQLINLLL